MGDIFSDERLNVVQLGYLTALSWTPSMVERMKGWILWHDKMSENVGFNDEGGMYFVDGEYLEYIKRINK